MYLLNVSGVDYVPDTVLLESYLSRQRTWQIPKREHAEIPMGSGKSGLTRKWSVFRKKENRAGERTGPNE